MKQRIVRIYIQISLIIVCLLFITNFLFYLSGMYFEKQINKEMTLFNGLKEESYSEQYAQFKKVKQLVLQNEKIYRLSRFFSPFHPVRYHQKFVNFLFLDNFLSKRASAEKNLLECAILLLEKSDRFAMNGSLYYEYSDQASDQENDLMLTQFYKSISRENQYFDYRFPPLFGYYERKISNLAYQVSDKGDYKGATDLLIRIQSFGFSKDVRLGLLALKAIREKKQTEAMKILDLRCSRDDIVDMNLDEKVSFLFVEMELNKLLHNDHLYWETINELIQQIEKRDNNWDLYYPVLFHIAEESKENGKIEVMLKTIDMIYSELFDHFWSSHYDYETVAKTMILLKEVNHLSLFQDHLRKLDEIDLAFIYLSYAKILMISDKEEAERVLIQVKNLLEKVFYFQTKLKIGLEYIKIQQFKNRDLVSSAVQTVLLPMIKQNTKPIDFSDSDNLSEQDSDFFSSNRIFSEMIELLLSNQLDKDLLYIADLLQNDHLKARIIQRVVMYYLKKGDFIEAENLAKNPFIDRYQSDIYDLKSTINQEIALSYYHHERYNQAYHIIKKADPDYQIRFYLQICQEALNSRKIEIAKAHLKQAFVLYQSLDYAVASKNWKSMADLGKMLNEKSVIDYINIENWNEPDVSDNYSFMLEKCILDGDVHHFLHYYPKLTSKEEKETFLIKALAHFKQDSRINQLAKKEATINHFSSVLSILHIHEASQLIKNKEYVKALQMTEKIDITFFKATILIELYLQWKNPDLTGQNGAILYRIARNCFP